MATVQRPSDFPTSDRVVYRINPLERVICQVQFPTILKIDASLPADFQDLLRNEYPAFQEKTQTVDVPEGLTPELRSLLISLVSQQQNRKAYEFDSADEKWSTSLTRDFLALTAKDYRRWEDFCGRWSGPYDALREVYSPPYFTRVGLRYVDVIQKSRLGLADVPWSDLIKPEIAGLLLAGESSLVVDAFSSTSQVVLPRFDARVRIQHGIGRPQGFSEDCYIIDSDFFKEGQIDATEIDGILDYFNGQAGRLFRWCIRPRLHDAMEPESGARDPGA